MTNNQQPPAAQQPVGEFTHNPVQARKDEPPTLNPDWTLRELVNAMTDAGWDVSLKLKRRGE